MLNITSFFFTGLGLPAANSASMLFDAILSEYAGRSKSLKEVRVVLFDKRMVAPFVSTIQSKAEKHNKNNKGIIQTIKAGIYIDIYVWSCIHQIFLYDVAS